MKNKFQFNSIWAVMDQVLKLGYFFLSLMYYSFKKEPKLVAGITTFFIVFLILNSLARFSLESFFIKNIFRYKGHSIFEKYFLIRLVFQLFFTLVFLSIYLFYDYLEFDTNIVLLFFTLNLLRIHEVFESYFKAHSNFKVIFISRCLSYFLTVSIILLFFYEGFLELIFIMDSLFMFIVLMIYYLNIFGIQKRNPLSWKKFKPIFLKDFNKTFYLTISFMLYIILSKIDWFSVYFLLDKESLGIYSFYHKLVDPVTALTAVLAISFYPELVKAFNSGYDRFKDELSKKVKLLSIIGYTIFLIGIIGYYLFQNLIISYFPNYSSGAIIVYILSLNIILFFNSCLRTYYLILTENSNIILTFNLITLLIFFPISLLLTYKYNIVGAAISSVLFNIFYQLIINFFVNFLKDFSIVQIRSLNFLNLYEK